MTGSDRAARVLGFVQARMGSTRLPGKIMEPLGDRTVLEWVVRAARASHALDAVVVATSRSPADDVVADLCAELGVACTRGSELDVLGRFVDAVRYHPCDAVVRLTADCPLLDPRLIDMVVGVWRQDPSVDYVSTFLNRSLAHGLDVELATVSALHAVAATTIPHHRTHVTSAIYGSPWRFSLVGLEFMPPCADLRLTLDTPEDLAALRAIVEARGTTVPSRAEIVELLRTRPDLVALNADVHQKALEDG